MSLEKISALNRADDEYLLIDQRRAIASTPSGLKNRMYKKIDRPTEETIQQYNKAHQQVPELVPLVDEDGEPILDENGKQIMKRYLFHPVEAKPDLEDPLEGIDAYTENEKEFLRDGETIRKEIQTEYNRVEKEFKTMSKLLKEVESRRGNVADELALESQIENITIARDNLAEDLKQVAQGFELLDNEKYSISQKDLHNKAIIESNRGKNKIKLKEYQEQLNLLNRGAFNMVQEPYESDEDYKQRLISHSQIEAPSEALYDARVYASKEIRNKFKEIIKNDTIIDLIANSLTNEQKYNIMKEWGSYAKQYKEIYGDYNPTQSVTDLVTFFTNPINVDMFKTYKSRGKVESAPVAPVAITLAQTDNFIIDVQDDIIQIDRLNKLTEPPQRTGERIFFRVALQPGKALSYMVVYSRTGAENSFVELKAEPFKSMLQNEYGFQPNLVDEIREQVLEFPTLLSSNANAKKLMTKYKIKGDVEGKTVSKKRGSNQAVYGWGIENKEVPPYSQFGNIRINTKKLYYDDVLSIRDKNGYQLQGMSPVKVSPNFTKLIIEILENKPVTMSDIEQLKSNERQLYDHLIAVGKLHKEKPHKIDETTERLKNQLEILEGEFNAGNNNPNIKRQIKTLLYKLHHFGTINSSQIKDYLKQL